YKKGRVREKRREFRRLQRCIRACLAERFSYLKIGKETKFLLCSTWNKEIEDRLDAFFCALIALWHWKHRGRRSEVIGDLRTGFILLPRVDV
ncbi:MAG: hypothetical protein V1746_00205, partial [bacterium]